MIGPRVRPEDRLWHTTTRDFPCRCRQIRGWSDATDHDDEMRSRAIRQAYLRLKHLRSTQRRGAWALGPNRCGRSTQHCRRPAFVTAPCGSRLNCHLHPSVPSCRATHHLDRQRPRPLNPRARRLPLPPQRVDRLAAHTVEFLHQCRQRLPYCRDQARRRNRFGTNRTARRLNSFRLRLWKAIKPGGIGEVIKNVANAVGNGNGTVSRIKAAMAA